MDIIFDNKYWTDKMISEEYQHSWEIVILKLKIHDNICNEEMNGSGLSLNIFTCFEIIIWSKNFDGCL